MYNCKPQQQKHLLFFFHVFQGMPSKSKGRIPSLFTAPRCSKIPELVVLRSIFEKKYGKYFVGAANDLRPDCGVNRMVKNVDIPKTLIII